MVGKELESPTIVHDLLDIGKVGSKPQYSMASDHPLLLYGCLYEDLPFNRSRQGLDSIRMEISSEISRYAHMMTGGFSPHSCSESCYESLQLVNKGHFIVEHERSRGHDIQRMSGFGRQEIRQAQTCPTIRQSPGADH